jgi:hypothetical protein
MFVSSENVEYGCPSKLMFVRWYSNTSTLEIDRNANIRAKMIADTFDNTNNLSLNIDGDIADRTPRIPHKKNMIPHQIP